MILTEKQRRETEADILAIGARLVTLDDMIVVFKEVIETTRDLGSDNQVRMAAVRGVNVARRMVKQGIRHLISCDIVLGKDEQAQKDEPERVYREDGEQCD